MANITASYLRNHIAEVWGIASREPVMVERPANQLP